MEELVNAWVSFAPALNALIHPSSLIAAITAAAIALRVLRYNRLMYL